MDLIKKSCVWYPMHVDRTESNGNSILSVDDRGQLVDLITDSNDDCICSLPGIF